MSGVGVLGVEEGAGGPEVGAAEGVGGRRLGVPGEPDHLDTGQEVRGTIR